MICFNFGSKHDGISSDIRFEEFLQAAVDTGLVIADFAASNGSLILMSDICNLPFCCCI